MMPAAEAQRPRAFAVVGSEPQLVIQVLLSVRTFSSAPCLALVSPHDRDVRRSRLAHAIDEAGMDGRDDERVIASLNEWATRYADSVIVAADCPGARLLHRVGPRLNARVAPLPDRETLETFDNKWTFYEFCRAHDLPAPESVRIQSKHAMDLHTVTAHVGMPFVVKPLREQAPPEYESSGMPTHGRHSSPIRTTSMRRCSCSAT
jgi:hypothetical protein